MTAHDVLDFWFLPKDDAGHGRARAEWFRKDDAFDAVIRSRFGVTLKAALGGGWLEWDDLGPEGTLARILVLDQFTRNAFRGTPASFSGDALALAASRKLVETGAHLQLTPLQRAFVYLPFEHAEDLAMQTQAVNLFTQLAAVDPAVADMLDYAHRHREVIARFGRFPHRNSILGRASTPDEAAFLQTPGSGF
jgi:uncharacterized protein (DUF924 family)